MQGKIVLVSNDSDFFEFIRPKLIYRNSDELFQYDFNGLQSILDSLNKSILIINSENNKEQAFELLNIVGDTPSFIFSYNVDEEFRIKAFNNGAFAYLTPEISDAELEALLKSALKMASSLDKNALYRQILVDNNIITKNNEVFLNFTNILDSEINIIHKNSAQAALLAIAPDENSKFIVVPNQIETTILNNVRCDDRLMNFAANKYFLLLHNTDLNKARTIWDKLIKLLPVGMHAGIVSIDKKTRQQVVNEALNKLHESINNASSLSDDNKLYKGNNFKYFRKEFKQKMEQIIIPVFYHVQQTYNDKLFGMRLEQNLEDGCGTLTIKSNHSISTLKISCPGFSTINIDFDYSSKNGDISDSKRITLEPEELDSGLLHDIVEQFITEFKDLHKINGDKNDNT